MSAGSAATEPIRRRAQMKNSSAGRMLITAPIRVNVSGDRRLKYRRGDGDDRRNQRVMACGFARIERILAPSAPSAFLDGLGDADVAEVIVVVGPGEIGRGKDARDHGGDQEQGGGDEGRGRRSRRCRAKVGGRASGLSPARWLVIHRAGNYFRLLIGFRPLVPSLHSCRPRFRSIRARLAVLQAWGGPRIPWPARHALALVRPSWTSCVSPRRSRRSPRP